MNTSKVIEKKMRGGGLIQPPPPPPGMNRVKRCFFKIYVLQNNINELRMRYLSFLI